MPRLHNPDWSNLKLSDFPQFKCLCELCDCGCFERSKLKHSKECKKRALRITDVLESNYTSNGFESATCYTSDFKKFQIKASNNKDKDAQKKKFESSSMMSLQTPKNESNSKNQNETNPIQLEFPVRLGPKADTVEIADKNAKFSTNTTNKDHFKSWNSDPAKPAAEHPEFTSGLIYRENKRRFRTTNEDMYLKNYGQFMAQSSAINLFDQTFKLNQGRMSLNTVYNNDYKELVSDRSQAPVSREQAESRHRQMLLAQKYPMQSQTQHKADYKLYDADSFKSASLMSFAHPDLFKSKLNKNLNPREEDENEFNGHANFPDSSLLSFANETKLHGDSSMRNKNFKFITTFDNQMLPKLRVIRELPGSKKSASSSKKPSTTSSQISQRQLSQGLKSPLINLNPNVDQEEINDPIIKQTTYRNDFQDHGIDVCMAKAYNFLSSKNSSRASTEIKLSN